MFFLTLSIFCHLKLSRNCQDVPTDVPWFVISQEFDYQSRLCKIQANSDLSNLNDQRFSANLYIPPPIPALMVLSLHLNIDGQGVICCHQGSHDTSVTSD